VCDVGEGADRLQATTPPQANQPQALCQKQHQNQSQYLLHDIFPLHTDQNKVTGWSFCLDIISIVVIFIILFIVANSHLVNLAHTLVYKPANGKCYNDKELLT
jgi:hypothetical protein